MHTITINPDDPRSVQAALNTEWLLTNGLGGYAMGTVLGVNTRRYHGLLVAATTPPTGRIVALHSMIEQLVIPRADGTEEVIDLSTQQFVGADGEPMLHPFERQRLVEVHVEPARVRWMTRTLSASVERTVTQPDGHNVVELRYRVEMAAPSAKLRLRAMVPLKDFHSCQADSEPGISLAEKPVITVYRGSTMVRIMADAGVWRNEAQWWQRFAYSADRMRGQEWREDVWSPGVLEVEVGRSHEFTVTFSASQPEVLESCPAPRQSAAPSEGNPLQQTASQFVANRHTRTHCSPTIIAGYPWFSDWGRDTMIALPGLLLCTGRLDEARGALLTFARHMRNGLIPNLFDEYAAGSGAGHYNTVDASLWFVHAVREWWRASAPLPLREGAGGWVERASTSSATDRSALHPLPNAPPQGGGDSRHELLAACRAVIAAYRAGTDFNIRMDSDGLIAAGDRETQLTWMDAKRDGVAFTPRHGKPVEINALWFNALHALAEMTDDDSERRDLLELAAGVETSFRAAFWWTERNCLHDCLSPGGDRSRETASGAAASAPDGKLRPNQIFAVSLPFSPLTKDQQRSVVEVVGARLLTPFGLRTLDRDDPDYRGRFEGDLFQRDAAYHNGTVWPWLLGPYCEALLRVNEFSADAKHQVRALLQPLIDEMSSLEGGCCLGQIAEVYDGDAPQRPGGCPAQAWSVGEVLRVMTLAGAT